MNFHLKKSAIFCICFSFLLSACKKDDISPIDQLDNPATGTNALYSGNTIITSVGGVVTDQNGTAISNALVTVGNKTGYTNLDGVFNINTVTVDDARAYVKIKKSGYFLGSRSFKPSVSTTNYVRIALLAKTVEGTINNASGGTINIAGGAALVFEPGDVSLENGSSYSGIITVQAAYLDPTASNIGKIMPGDLTALDNSNQAVVLQTYGMLVIELVGSNGEALNIAQGKTVQIKMPIQSQQSAMAPATIPLWHFDETYGNWLEEGQATLQGSFYVGEVSHFSFWNCDVSFPIINLDFTVVCNGAPLTNTLVTIATPAGGVNYAYTDANGHIDGGVPENMTLLLKIIDECDNIIYSQSFSTSTNNLNLGTISACNNGNQVTISGVIVNCNGFGVENGLLQVSFGVNTMHLFTNQNGEFSTVISTCYEPEIHIIAFDPNNAMQSNEITIQNGTNNNLGAIITCGQIDEFIIYSIDAINSTILDFGLNEVSSGYNIDSTAIYGASSNSNNIFLKLINPIIGNNSCQLRWVNGLSIEFPSVINANITTLGTTSGSYIEGTFSGTFNEAGGGLSHSISGNFRTKNE